MLYTHLQHHNDTIIKQTHAERRRKLIRRSNKRRGKTSLQIYLPLTLFVRFEKVVWGFTVRGSWRSNITAIFWPLTLMTVTLCLSCSLVLLNRRPRAHSSGPKGPFGLMWLSLPHFVSTGTRTLWPELNCPEPNSSGSSNSTELYNRSTPTRSFKSNV